MTTPADLPSYTALLYETPATPLLVSSFVPGAETPGNVAVCLSGGGSRALSAGKGALQALEFVKHADGSSLLSNVKALSVVSGGAWLGVPFMFLDAGTPDDAYLGSYTEPGNLTIESLLSIEEPDAGANVTEIFSVVALALEALVMYLVLDVPADRLWQTLMGWHLLDPYGLFTTTGDDLVPASYFSYDTKTRDAIVAANPSLADEPCSLVTANRPRPYLVINTSVFVTAKPDESHAADEGPALAPVQSTPFFTGVVGSPDAVTLDDLPVGGGGVTTFAFASHPTAVVGTTVTVEQKRRWSLSDAVGTSSAAFAVSVYDMMHELAGNPPKLAGAITVHHDRVEKLLRRSGTDPVTATARVTSLARAARTGDLAAHRAALAGLDDIIPRYRYWSVPPNVPQAASAGNDFPRTPFADGGSLDNSGVAAMLAYHDIDTIIAFTNTLATIRVDGNGIVVVDDALPPLFGYQPYDATTEGGYQLSGAQVAVDTMSSYYRFNQVFPSDQFQSLLDGLWGASDNYQTAPIFLQTLVTQANTWFGVPAGRTVIVLWVYLESANDWYDSLEFLVKGVVDFESAFSNFPHYSTEDTQLSATQVNLLSNLVAFSVVNNAATFQALFPSPEAPPA